MLLLALPAGLAGAEEITAFTNSVAYSDGQPLFVYGTAAPGESLIVRLFAPDGTIAKFDQTIADPENGSFNHGLLVWPESSPSFPYGTYTVEVISTKQDVLSHVIDVKFTSSSELVGVPVDRQINTLVFAPDTAAVNAMLRVFVQSTSDGQLIGGHPDKLLKTTHVHLPDGTVQRIADSFQTLHQGLYYADYTPTQLGTYVFHVVTFHQGVVSHGSFATIVQRQDIGGISEEIRTLNTILHESSDELDRLKSEIAEFGVILEQAHQNLDSSVVSVSDSVSNIEEASVQLNSLLFPVVASIAVIVALQIIILARRR